MDDAAVVVAQIGRPLRSRAQVVARCPLGLPVVTRVPPILDDGTPFPTSFWLSCPLANRRIGRLESARGVRTMEEWADEHAEFAAELDTAHERYRQEREAELSADAHPRPSGGVAGVRTGVKCLHAHYADHAAGNANPVGVVTAPWVEPLDCTTPCVAVVDGAVARNPEWSEPK